MVIPNIWFASSMCHILLYSFFCSIPSKCRQYYTHFTDRETEVQKSVVLIANITWRACFWVHWFFSIDYLIIILLISALIINISFPLLALGLHYSFLVIFWDGSLNYCLQIFIFSNTYIQCSWFPSKQGFHIL